MQPVSGINPSVIIGLGGTGKDVIARTRRLIVERFGALENLPIVAFLSIDTDDAPAGIAEVVMGQDIALRHQEKVVLDAAELGPILSNLAQYEHLSSWVPPELGGVQDLTSGAKQIRALGRLAFFTGHAAVKEAVVSAVKRVTDRDHVRMLADRHGLSISSGVDVYVVSSLCGGTGSGMLLDVAYNLRKWFRYDGLVNEVDAYLLLPGAFTGVSDRVKANAYACLKELNHHMGLGRAEVEHFRARYSHSSLDELDETGPAFDFCYLIGDQNKAIDSARLTDLQEMIAQKLALEVASPFSRYAKSNRSNLEGVWQVTPRDAFNQPQNFLAFGLASLRFPMDRLARALGARLASELVLRWRRSSGETGGSSADFERFLAKQKWLENNNKAHFSDALRLMPQGGSFSDYLERWVEETKRDVMDRTNQLGSSLTDIDTMLWDHHRALRDRTRGAGSEPSQWGELSRAIFDNMKKLRAETEKGLAVAVGEACNDPARGPRYALWLLDELRTMFEQARETYLALAKHLQQSAPKERDLKQALAKFDPLAETLWLRLTMQLRGKLEGEIDAYLARLRAYHAAQLEDKLREVGAFMFGKLLVAVAEQRTRVERVERELELLGGELHGLEKDVVAEILGLNYAHTLYLFEASDVDTYYAERFGNAEDERSVLSALATQALAGCGGQLLDLPSLARADDRKAFMDSLVAAASRAFLEGERGLMRTSVAERFIRKYPERKRQEAILKDLANHANPFIHLDGKQAAHKFSMTPVQRVVGLADAESSQPPRAVGDVLAALASACQVTPGQIKPSPDPQALIMVQEFGAFPLRVIKGLEGYKACYQHYLDRHLHITRAREAYADLFPPDEAKAAEALRGLTLGLALGLAAADPTDGRTVVYRYKDAAGLSDELVLGTDEQSGVAVLVEHDEARARLLLDADELGKRAQDLTLRRTLYDGLVRYARAMENKLGARHPRYQAQRKVLGDYIKTYLAGADAAPATEAVPMSAAAVVPASEQAQVRYEALFQHFWVDRMIGGAERAALEQAAAQLGLSVEQARAIEARAAARDISK